MMFHGVSVVVKGPPWLPRGPDVPFDFQTSLCDEDFALIREGGGNFIRLGVMWPGVEPAKGQYNFTYLEALRNVTDRAAAFGIYTLLDMHQDSLSEHCCGEGIPGWRYTPSAGAAGTFPKPLQGTPFARDPRTGFPSRQDCAKHGWDSFEVASECSSAYESLYHDGAEDWGRFWATVASYFAGRTHILGLELINEPFAGDLYKNPLIMVPGVADRLNLAPAYDVLNRHIRAVDDDVLLFFAGVTWDDTPSGFQHPPGGAAFGNRSVLTFHFYAPPQIGKPQAAVDGYFLVKRKDALRLNTGWFMSESYIPTDQYRVSAGWWAWKTYCRETNATLNGTSQNGVFGACKTGPGSYFEAGKEIYNTTTVKSTWKYKCLGTPYATHVAGRVVSIVNHDVYCTQNMTLTYVTAPSSMATPATARTTRVFVRAENFENLSFHVDIKTVPPAAATGTGGTAGGGATWKRDGHSNWYDLVHAPGTSMVTLAIWSSP